MRDRPDEQTTAGERAADSNPHTLEDTIVQAGTNVTTNRGPETGPISSLGRYDLGDVLGEGGFGTVYRAWDRELGRDVAVKLMHGSLLARKQDAQRFVQEAQTAAKLNHPNICPVYDMGQSQGMPYIVMGLVEGKTLDEFIESGKTITPRQAVHTVYKLTAALKEAHRQGIVHRDLKPANIMIAAKRNQLMILDFGLARQLNAKGARLTLSGQLLGTPLYMAPEQVRGEIDNVGPRADVYSLGVILYRMLAGRGPFKGSVAEVFAQVLYEEPEPPSAFLSSVSPALDTICLKAMAKDPDLRYQTMAEFGRSLARFLKGETKSAEPRVAQDSGLDMDWLTMPEMEIAPAPNASAPNALNSNPSAPNPRAHNPRAANPRPRARAPRSSPASRSTPAKATAGDAFCPKCDAAMSTGTKLCQACGFHQGLHQQFDVIGNQSEPSPQADKQSWLAEQLGEGETPEAFALAAACFVPIATILLVALLYGLFGPWAFLGVGLLLVPALLILSKVLGWRIDPASMRLYVFRARAWRSVWHPAKVCNVLDLRNSLTVDADLKSLKKKWGLEVLDLENTRITDAAVEQLSRLDSLRFLVLRRTQISADGITRLRQLMPTTRIWS